MSPDSDAVKWLVVILACVQTVATLVQVTSNSSRTNGSGESAPLDHSVKLGLTLLPIAVLLVFLAPYFADGRANADDTMGNVVVLFSMAGPGFAGYVGGYNTATLLREPTSGRNAVANVTAVAAALLIVVVVASWLSPYSDEVDTPISFLVPGALGFGLGYVNATSGGRTARKQSEESDSSE